MLAWRWTLTTKLICALSHAKTCAARKPVRGRVKDKSIRRDPRVSLSSQDPENPYRYLEIRGKVVEITEKGADEHINGLAKKYLGKDVYPGRKPGETRVLYKIEPQKFSSMG